MANGSALSPLAAFVALIVAVALLLPALTRSSEATAQTPTDGRAGAPVLSALTATGEGLAMYPPFDPGTHHYAVGCSGGTLTLSLAAAADTRMAVNGVRLPDRSAVVEVTGLSGDSDVVIGLDTTAGESAVYTVHCLPDDFPSITVRKSPDASNILMTASVDGQDKRYNAILDTNGVPRLHYSYTDLGGLAYHKNGLYPYSESRRQDRVTIDGNQTTHRDFIVRDWDMTIMDIVSTIAPLTHTDQHDFFIRPNGNYIMLAYEPGWHDFSAFNDEDGNPYGTHLRARDSVIQEITPEREQVFLWNSWDHVALEDCTQHRFPDGYAHINSLEVVDGDIIASLRGCSQVLRIDGTTGKIVWLLGKSNRGDAGWLASNAPAPLKIADDPYGEFCGQHSAQLGPNGNLVLFDNGAHCQVDPATGTTARESGVFSRVVEYSLDPQNGQATFLRHYSLHGTFDRYQAIGGHVELLDNGNWLVSWRRRGADPRGPDYAITEVDPRTGRELLAIRITDVASGAVLGARAAYPLPLDALERRPTARLTELEPGRNLLVWRGSDDVSIEESIRETWPVAAVTAIHTRDTDSGAWLSFFPDSPPGVNSLSAFAAGRTYWVFARERARWDIPHAPRDQIPDQGDRAFAE